MNAQSRMALRQLVGDSLCEAVKDINIPLTSARMAKAQPREAAVPAAVDFGLSVKWADCNVGATSPEHVGTYVAWGGFARSDSDFSEINYEWLDSGEYINIGDDISRTFYDYATQELGPDWRIPTRAEWEELINNCGAWTVTTLNGVAGYEVKTDAGSSESIFLPFGGYYDETDLNYSGERGYYHTSTIATESKSYDVKLNSKECVVRTSARYRGKPIRAVYDPIESPHGDVVGDGNVNLADARAVIEILLRGGVGIGQSALKRADVNGDAVVNITDADCVIALIMQGE